MNRYLISFIVAFLPRVLAIVSHWQSPAYREVFLNNEAASGYFLYPGYVVLTNILISLSFGSLVLFTMYQVFIHAAIGPVVLRISETFSFSKSVNWLSVIGVSFLPYYVSLSVFQPQTGIVVVLMGLVILFFSNWKNGGFEFKKGVYLPVILIVILFFRPEGVVVMGALFGIYLGLQLIKNKIKATKSIIFIGLIFLGFVLVTMLVNGFVTSNYKLPLPEHGGRLLYQGNNPYIMNYITAYTQSLYVESFYADHPLPNYIAKEKNQKKADKMKRDLAINFIKENPLLFVKITAIKFLRYWDVRLDDANVESLAKNLIYTIPYIIYFSLFIYGLIGLIKNKNELSILFITVFATHSLFLSVAVTAIRYRMIFEFLLIILASKSLIDIKNKLKTNYLTGNLNKL